MSRWRHRLTIGWKPSWRGRDSRWRDRRNVMLRITTLRQRSSRNSRANLVRWLRLIYPSWRRIWKLRVRHGLRGECRSGARSSEACLWLASDATSDSIFLALLGMTNFLLVVRIWTGYFFLYGPCVFLDELW